MKRQSGTGIAADALKFVRANQLISRGLKMIPHPVAQGAGYLAQQAGLGKKKPRKRRTVQKGAGFFTDIGNGLGGIARGIGGGLFGGGEGQVGGARKRVKRSVILV